MTTRVTWARAAAAGMLALLLSCVALPTQTVRAASESKASSVYWGASIGTQLTGTQAPWDMAAVTAFESKVGKPLSLLGFSSPFADCSSSPCSFYRFPAGPMENVRRYGAIPFFSWGSQSTPASRHQPDFQLADVIRGDYDAYIRSFATAAKSWGHPFFLRFNAEMNGPWFAWSAGVNGNSPGQYVAAWRHVHDIFTSVGATNATWVWCPNVDPDRTYQKLRPLYPGNAYVDWTCLDGFNWGGSPRDWQHFDRVFHSTYSRIARKIAPSKPMIIGETASGNRGGSKAAWVKGMLRALATGYHKIHGVLWFDVYDSGMPWPIETSRRVTRAFGAGIRSSAFTPNLFADIGASPIRPPG
jgi:hypothetical protein